MQVLSGKSDARGLRFAIVVARFNDFVTDRLREGALRALAKAGAADDAVVVLPVPGSFEVPQAAFGAAQSGRFDAVVCLGCLIRGETPHFEYISSAVAHGITQAALATGIPMTFGVLTTNSAEEALERAGPGESNKGWEAAVAAVEMATVLRQLGPARSHRVPSVTRTLTRAERSKARRAALQMLYQFDIAGGEPREVVSNFWHLTPTAIDEQAQPATSGKSSDAAWRDLAEELMVGTAAALPRIDTLITEHAKHWRLARLAVIDRAILRLGAFELLERPSTPSAVVINEALELARRFSSEDAVPFINGVLDAIRQADAKQKMSDL